MNAVLDDLSVATGAAVDPALLHEANDALAGVDVPFDPSAPPIVEPTPPSAETAAMCTTLLGVTFNHALAPRLGDHWKLADDECSALGAAYGAVLDKYFPNLRAGPEVAAIVVTLAVLGPRVMMTVQAAHEKTKPIEPAAVGQVVTDPTL